MGKNKTKISDFLRCKIYLVDHRLTTTIHQKITFSVFMVKYMYMYA